MTTTINSPVDRLIDVAAGIAEPQPGDLEHRKYRRRAQRSRVAVLPVDQHGRHQVRLLVRTIEVSAAGFSAIGRRPIEPGSACAVLLPQTGGDTALVGAFVVRCRPDALGGWELGFQFGDKPVTVTIDDLRGYDGCLPLLGPPIAVAA